MHTCSSFSLKRCFIKTC